MFRKFKSKFLTAFRGVFVYHHRSLEFRAKLIAAVLATKREINVCEKEYLHTCALTIYPDDTYRQEILVHTVFEYLGKMKYYGLGLDKLIFDINRDIRFAKRFRSKVDIALLTPFLSCTDDEEERFFRGRVLEFFETVKEK